MADPWREKYLYPAIASAEKVALIGIGDLDAYLMHGEERAKELSDVLRLANSGSDYCVYDIDENLVAKAQEKGVHTKICDVTKSRLSDLYDWIFVSDVVEHVNDPPALMQNLSDSLRHTGRLVLTTPNSIYWRNFLSNRFREHPEHNFTFHRKHLENLCRRADLKVVELSSFQTTEGVKTAWQKLRQTVHLRMAGIGLGNSLMLVAKKAE